VELRRLKCFIAVAECLHFGRAAKRLHIVQSAVSQPIKVLEDELSVKLLKRSRHKVELTDAGRVLLAEARRVVQQTQEAVPRTPVPANSADCGSGSLTMPCGRCCLPSVEHSAIAIPT
jgi:DNA-binding transcriptional LysR family regulator